MMNNNALYEQYTGDKTLLQSRPMLKINLDAWMPGEVNDNQVSNHTHTTFKLLLLVI